MDFESQFLSWRQPRITLPFLQMIKLKLREGPYLKATWLIYRRIKTGYYQSYIIILNWLGLWSVIDSILL